MGLFYFFRLYLFNMSKNTFARFKPGVSRNVHLFLAGTLWTTIGIFLMTRGVVWLAGAGKLWLVAPAMLLGSLKSLIMLDKTARKSVDRIRCFADGTCLGAIYSYKTWMLVMMMMGAGIALRHSSMPSFLLGLLYTTIGWGLFLSSRHAWICWLQEI